jgi:hypothetical protein
MIWAGTFRLSALEAAAAATAPSSSDCVVVSQFARAGWGAIVCRDWCYGLVVAVGMRLQMLVPVLVRLELD